MGFIKKEDMEKDIEKSIKKVDDFNMEIDEGAKKAKKSLDF